jgi:hypothetical protein
MLAKSHIHWVSTTLKKEILTRMKHMVEGKIEWVKYAT